MHHNHRCEGRRRQSRARSPKSIPNETTENRVLRLFPRSRPPSEVLSSFRTLQIRRCRATVTVMRARTGGHPGFENLPNGMLVYWPAVLALVKIRMLSTSILESSVSIHLTDVLIAATRISISHEFFPRENINRPLRLLVRSEKSVSNLPNLPSSKARPKRFGSVRQYAHIAAYAARFYSGFGYRLRHCDELGGQSFGDSFWSLMSIVASQVWVEARSFGTGDSHHLGARQGQGWTLLACIYIRVERSKNGPKDRA